ncbi:MAG TPA: alpha/beta hydrolase [Anaerolineae bacterium]|nr:alpha/beta hydrolase [Anaerolineae bacterium]
MTNHVFSWKSYDGLQLFAQEWRPKQKPIAAIALVHGLGEHSSRYTHVADFFNKSNIGMVSYDLRGHGKSEGKRGHIPSDESILRDIDFLLKETKKRYQGLPIFLYGHSMGGEFILFYSIKKQPKIVGVIATAPSLKPKVPIPFPKYLLAKTMNIIYPSIQMDNGLDRSGLSHDKEVVMKYNHDPLVHGLVSARLGLSIIENGKWILENANNLKIPLLLMVGEKERLVNKQAISNLAKKVSKINFKIWPGLYHELHNEPEKIDVLNYIISWISERIAAPKS